MKNRCTNTNYEGYKYYGGRGIKVCDEWLEFEPFLEWALKNDFRRDLQIDRIDVDGNYSPHNCRWVTPKVNSQNKRRHKQINIKGEIKTLSQWAETSGLSVKTISDRIQRGWREEEILLPVGTRKSKGKCSYD